VACLRGLLNADPIDGMWRKHVVKVRATVGGVTEDTPATATWHVVLG
jgi:hypothetical protein